MTVTEETFKPPPEGLGGWLIPIGLFIGIDALLMLASLIESVHTVSLIGTILAAVYTCWLVWLLFLFAGKRQIFPKMFIAIAVVGWLQTVLALVLYGEMWRFVLYSAIVATMIVYMARSERVEETFVNCSGKVSSGVAKAIQWIPRVGCMIGIWGSFGVLWLYYLGVLTDWLGSIAGFLVAVIVAPGVVLFPATLWIVEGEFPAVYFGLLGAGIAFGCIGSVLEADDELY